MIDERLLADPGRCPSCAANLIGGPLTHCPECGVHLQGASAARLWRVSVEAAGLLAERARLIDTLRREAGQRANADPLAPATSVAAPTVPASIPISGPPPGSPGQVAPGQPPLGPLPPGGSLAPPGPLPPAYAPPVRAEWTPQRVQTLLLALGVGLLAVAAVIFVAVSWGRLGVGGRAAVLTGVTALSGAAAWWAYRKALGSTAEALSVLTVGLGLLDCFGAWAADLGGLRSLDGASATGLSAGLVGGLAAVASTRLRTRALEVSAAVLLQLVVPLVVGHQAGMTEHPYAVFAFGILLNVLAGTAVLLQPRLVAGPARVLVATGTAMAAAISLLTAMAAAYGEQGSLVAGTALVLLWGLAAWFAADLLARLRPDRSLAAWRRVLAVVAAGLVVLAVWAPLADQLSGRWLPVALSGAALALLLACLLVPADRRRVAATVVLGAVILPGSAALGPLGAAAAGRLQWLGNAWSGPGGSARAMLESTAVVAGFDVTVSDAWAAMALVAVVVAALAAGSLLVHREVLLAVPLAVLGAGLMVPLAVDLPYAVGLAVDVVLAVLGLAVALLARRSGQSLALTAAAGGVLGLSGAVSWSFGTSGATVILLPVAAAVLAGTAVFSRPDPMLRIPRLACVAGAFALLSIEAGAVTRRADGSDPAVAVALLTVLALLTASALGLALHGNPPARSAWRSGVAVVAYAAVVGDVPAVVLWSGAGWAAAGLGLAVASALLLIAAAGPVAPHRLSLVVDEAYAVGAVGATAGLVLEVGQPQQLWLGLLAVGAAVAVLAVRVDDRFGWLSGLLLTASSWVRLAESDVTMPEAYTVPPGLALLAVGWWKRRSDQEIRSWRAYGAGLGLVLLPSLLRSLTDSGNVRPLLLALAALVVLAVGVSRRLQAPLVLGAGVLAVDAFVQLSPYLAMAYDVAPRWATIGLVGLMLVAAGATYEKRLRDVRRVARQLGSLG